MAVLIPGKIDDDGNWIGPFGMAFYIEKALPPPDDPEDSGKFGRRQFFIAISTGVIDYLRLNENQGFLVHVDPNTNTGTVEIR